MGEKPQGLGVKLPIHRYDDLEAFFSDDYKLLDTEIGEIDTGVETSPKTVLTPPSGHFVCIRGIFLFTNSSSGEVSAYFANSNQVIAKIYASRFSQATLPKIHKDGEIDENVIINWDGLSTGAKIFYVILYKFIRGG